MQKFLSPLIPILFNQLSAVSTEDKRNFAEYISVLCRAYCDADRETFEYWLDKSNLFSEFKPALMKALWDNEN